MNTDMDVTQELNEEEEESGKDDFELNEDELKKAFDESTIFRPGASKLTPKRGVEAMKSPEERTGEKASEQVMGGIGTSVTNALKNDLPRILKNQKGNKPISGIVKQSENEIAEELEAQKNDARQRALKESINEDVFTTIDSKNTEPTPTKERGNIASPSSSAPEVKNESEGGESSDATPEELAEMPESQIGAPQGAEDESTDQERNDSTNSTPEDNSKQNESNSKKKQQQQNSPESEEKNTDNAGENSQQQDEGGKAKDQEDTADEREDVSEEDSDDEEDAETDDDKTENDADSEDESDASEEGFDENQQNEQDAAGIEGDQVDSAENSDETSKEDFDKSKNADRLENKNAPGDSGDDAGLGEAGAGSEEGAGGMRAMKALTSKKSFKEQAKDEAKDQVKKQAKKAVKKAAKTALKDAGYETVGAFLAGTSEIWVPILLIIALVCLVIASFIGIIVILYAYACDTTGVAWLASLAGFCSS